MMGERFADELFLVREVVGRHRDRGGAFVAAGELAPEPQARAGPPWRHVGPPTVLPGTVLQQLPGVAVDPGPVSELGAAVLVVDQLVLGMVVCDPFDAVQELVEATDRAELHRGGVVALVDERLGEVEVADRAIPVQWGEHPGEQQRADPPGVPVGEVVEVEQRSDLLPVVIDPEQLRHMPRVEARVEVGGAAVRAWVKTDSGQRRRPDRLAERMSQRVAHRVGHVSELADPDRGAVLVVAAFRALANRVDERASIRQVRKLKRTGQHSRERGRIV
jgi:hypothetical protein